MAAPRLSLLTLALGAAMVAVPAAPAAAAEPCRGETATIVGSPGATLTGSEGRDVVVTAGASAVTTLGGDDLVCVTGGRATGGGYRTVTIDTGAGTDVVDGTAAAGWATETVLGAGSDEFLGGPQRDQVIAGAPGATFVTTLDTDADVIGTGAGDDWVRSGEDPAVNPDRIDLGDGRDHVTWRGRGAGSVGQVVGGEGLDTLTTIVSGADAGVDNATGRLTSDGVDVATLSGMEDFFLDRVGPAPTAVRFHGGPGDERVTLKGSGAAAPGVLDIDLGAGDDAFGTDAPGAPGSAYAGGPGRDDLAMGSTDDSLALDLRRGRLEVGGGVSPATGLEDAHLMARRVTVKGTDAANWLRTTGCRQTMVGRSGPDRVRVSFDGWFEEFRFDCRQRAHVKGGKGHDEMRGTLGHDRLVGNAGRDTALGRAGRDLCRAEVTRTCER